MKRELLSEADLSVLPDPRGDNSAALPSVTSAADLYNGQMTAPRALFDNLLFDGLTMLIARPKAGKSWLTLQCAVMVAGGRPISGIAGRDRGPVLYAALEEPQTRTIARLRELCEFGEWARHLHFVYELLPLMGGGADQLRNLIAKTQPRLIVLDTLTALIKSGARIGGDVFRSQYAEVSALRKLAEDHRTAILIVHHSRKGLADGAIEAVAGTGGIAAAVDALWYLKRKPEGEATLEIVGREIQEQTLAMRFGDAPIGWRILGNEGESMLSGERNEVLALLKEDGGLTPAQIATELGKSRPAIRKLLQRMRVDLQVSKQGSKYYPSIYTHSVSHRVTERERESE